MTVTVKILFIVVILTGPLNDVSAYQVRNNPFRRATLVDPQGKYLLEREVDWSNQRITFNVTVETRGWVGLGLSNKPGSGADIVIGGVGSNGEAYFSDRHTVGGSKVSVLDAKQDWTLHSAWESRTHTVLCFSRSLDTCDPEDYPLTTINSVTIHWAYGRKDDEDGYSSEESGTLALYLLDPDYAPQIVRNSGVPVLITKNSNENIPADSKTWSVQKSVTLSRNDTSYLCTIHRAPRLQQKHHFIGYDLQFLNEESRLHTHHMDIYRCHAPPGVSPVEMFEPQLGEPGQTCHMRSTFPTPYCTELYIVWNTGARTFFLPNHVGFPFGEAEDEYYLIQAHYDNAQQKDGVQVDLRLDFFYTNQLRPIEGGSMSMGHEIPGLPESQLVPPDSTSHRISGHCSSECTRRMYPPGGITISAVQLHSHEACMGMRLRHFRGDTELPWIIYDDNYDNQYQPIRHLRNEVRILPGDQLTVDCLLTSGDDTVVGGYSTRQEMCVAFLIHYERVKDYSSCGSEINSEAARLEFLGVRNVSWVKDKIEWIVQTPTRLAGLKVSEVSDRFVNWTPERRRRLERFHEVHPHSGGCHKDLYTRDLIAAPPNPPGIPLPLAINTMEDYRGPVSYPFGASPYTPPERSCPNRKGFPLITLADFI